MNIVFAAAKDQAIVLPLGLLLWLNVIGYALHVLEEALVPETFVDKVKRLYFPAYDWRKFFAFNAALLTLNVVAVLLYDSLSVWWIVLPLGLMVERVLNGIWHLGETIATGRYSAGLLMSIVAWIAFYLLVRYGLLRNQVAIEMFLTACGIGLAVDLAMMVPLYLGAFRKMR